MHLSRIVARYGGWSDESFGPGPRTAPLIDHVEKELREIRAAEAEGPLAVAREWVDIFNLGLDGLRRAARAAHPGETQDRIAEICEDLVLDKFEVLQTRTYPDWRTADPTRAIEHVRAGEAEASGREVGKASIREVLAGQQVDRIADVLHEMGILDLVARRAPQTYGGIVGYVRDLSPEQLRILLASAGRAADTTSRDYLVGSLRAMAPADLRDLLAEACLAVAPATSDDRPEPEQVDHPAHYGGADDPYEVIKVLEAWLTPDEFRGAMKFNVIKYLARAGRKDPVAVDVAKAAWYAARLAEYEKKEAPG